MTHSICEDCSIEDKLFYCCGQNPITKEQKDLLLDDGREVKACNFLNSEGKCSIYEKRPLICYKFEDCPKYYEKELELALKLSLI